MRGQLAQAMTAESTGDPLYNMEYGLLQRLQAQYSPSNYYFAVVEQNLDLWSMSWLSSTGGQLSTQALTLLLNDNVLEYKPRSYERTLVATYHALNHLDLNDTAKARVEIKRMYQFEQATENYNQALYSKSQNQIQAVKQDKTQNYLAQQILQKYNFSDLNRPEVLALKNSYQNAFSHYLAGFVFEALNEPSLARPGYVKAGQLNPHNKLIQQSIDQIDANQRPGPGYTELLLVEETGHAPQIKSEEVHIPFKMNLTGQKNSCVNMVNLFFPRLVLDQSTKLAYEFSVDQQLLQPVALVNLNLMAARALKDEIPHLIARNVAAAARNIITSQQSCSSGGDLGTLLSLGVSLGGMLLDRADERSWTLLPQQINIARLRLPYGAHKINITVNGIPYQRTIELKQAYQVLDFRVLGNQVFWQ